MRVCSGEKKARRWLRVQAIACLIALALSVFDLAAFAAPMYRGQVTFGGLPVPGVTVTATRDDKKLVAITDAQGAYSFTDIDDGPWKFEVEMQGFTTQTQELTVAADAPNQTWELKLLPLDELTPAAAPAPVESTPAAGAPVPAAAGTPNPATSSTGNSAASATGGTSAGQQSGYQRANVNRANNAPPSAPAAAQAPPPPADTTANNSGNSGDSDLSQRAASGLVVNGSVNNGAASAFAQASAFGNNRRGPGSLYNGFLGVTFNTSAWDARAYSQTGATTPKPSYNNVTIFSSVGGPLRIPHFHPVQPAQFFVAYQHAMNDNATTAVGRVPTLLERTGDLSQTLDAVGQPVKIFHPGTSTPYAGNVVPVSAQAAALLNLYPKPNASSLDYNYQAPALTSTTMDSFTSRVSKGKGRNQFVGTLASQWQNRCRLP